MIKNIYNNKNKYYKHEYYCDYCLIKITFGQIFRNEQAIKNEKYDLCSVCFNKWENLCKKCLNVLNVSNNKKIGDEND